MEYNYKDIIICTAGEVDLIIDVLYSLWGTIIGARYDNSFRTKYLRS